MFDTGYLGDLIQHHIGGGTPSRGATSFWNGDIPWASVKDFEDGITELATTQESISEKGLNASSSNLIPAGNLIICSRMAVGRAAICLNDTAINQDLKAIFPYEEVDTRYLLHLINWLRPKIESQSLGSTVKGIRVADLLAIPCHVAPSDEQPFIAKIVDDIDTQIRETETIIAKLQQVKQGLLHDLLTRGVDENGELRPSYEDAPELYKSSELGWIPKNWDVVTVGSEVNIKHGFAFDGALFTSTPTGYPLLVPGNFHRDGGLYFAANNTKYYNGEYPSDYLLEPRDVVIVMTDLSPQTLILGKAAVLSDTQWLLHNQRIGKVIFKCEDEWDKNFFVESISQENIRRNVIITATGTTVRHTSPDRICALDITKPPFDEQHAIHQIIKDAWERLSKESDQLVKLRLKKSGLMDDLLTGKKRVTDLLKQQAN